MSLLLKCLPSFVSNLVLLTSFSFLVSNVPRKHNCSGDYKYLGRLVNEVGNHLENSWWSVALSKLCTLPSQACEQGWISEQHVSSTTSDLSIETKPQLEVSSLALGNVCLANVTWLLCVLFEAQCYCVAQARLEFMILLPQPSYCWDYRLASLAKPLLCAILRDLLKFR